MDTLSKSKILNLIRLYGPVSRTSLAEMMDISLTAVAKYVSELISEGIICEAGSKKSSGGRKAVLLDLNLQYGYMISIDFGQSIFRVSALKLNNEIIVKKSISTKELGPPQYGIKKIINMINEIKNDVTFPKKLLAVGIAVSGMVKEEDSSRVMMLSLNEWTDFDIVNPIKEKFGVPVFIDDSSRMMALCESVKPGDGRFKNLVFINIGTGIGTGIIIFGRLFRGLNGMAGELGHIIVKEGGNICGCGNHGCLEQYVSVPSMVNNARRAIINGVRSSIFDFAGKNINEIDSFSLARAIEERDKLAYNIAIEAGNYLGIGVSQIINLFNPELIIIGGGGAEISEVVIDEVKKTCQIRALYESAKNVKIIKSQKGNDCALIGASIFAQDNLFELSKIQEKSLL